MSLLGGERRTIRQRIHLPPAGGWIGHVVLQQGAPPAPGPTTVQIGDLVLVGAVLADPKDAKKARGGLDAPDRPHVVVAGGYGWRAKLAAGRYSSPSSVRLLTVLRDLGAAAGEAYDAPADALLGPSYNWIAGTRGRAVLADLVDRGAIPTWRVDPATGRARFDAWPALGAADAFGRVEDRSLERGFRKVALDTAAKPFLPGATLEGTTVARVTFEESEDELYAEVWEQ